MKKKKCFILVTVLLLSFITHSQILIAAIFGDKLNSEGLEFGLELGYNWSDISNLEADKRLSAFNLGFYFDFRLKNQWHLYTGVLVKAKLGGDELSSSDLECLGINPNTEEGTYSQKINYFVVPALIKYNLKNRIYFEAGPQFSLMHKAWVEFFFDKDNKKTRIREFNKNKINKLDVGITAGTIPDTGMTIGVKYYYGFANVYKEVSGSNNSSFFLKLNTPHWGGQKSSYTMIKKLK